MSNEKDYENASKHIIDMLLDTTLKKHGVELEPSKVAPEQKEQLKEMIEQLKKSVEALNQDKKEEKEEKKEEKE